MHKSDIDERLKKARKVISAHGLDALIVPTADPHMSEYVAEHYGLRKYLSGFTGSAGTLVIAPSRAALITDSRYWEQATSQLKGTRIELIRQKASSIQEVVSFLKEVLSPESKVGYFKSLLSRQNLKILHSKLIESQLDPTPVDENVIDEIWSIRPPLKHNEIFEHSICPRSVNQKLEKVKDFIKDNKAEGLIVSSLDNVAWLTNLRGSDIPDNPVFYGYALIRLYGDSLLFVDKDSLPKDLAKKLEDCGFVIESYDNLNKRLKRITDTVLIADPKEINGDIYSVLKANNKIIEKTDPVSTLKALKTPTEVDLIFEAMKKDGVALVKFYSWLEKHIGREKLTEPAIAQKLLEFRKQQPGFVSPSFETICAFGPHAALPHYMAREETPETIIGNDGFLLIDSGAQFPEGTTDITRTILVGKASQLMKQDYTAVLKGHIRLAKAIFPVGITSVAIDALARAPIWEKLCDYGHGTGHGVGFFLSVHEGPQFISYPRINDDYGCKISPDTKMLEGMVTSDEPGIYRPGLSGVRIENLLVNESAGRSEFGEFLKFRVLTLCPIDTKPLIVEELEPSERNWLNEYHAIVRVFLTPLLLDDPESLMWLIENTASV